MPRRHGEVVSWRKLVDGQRAGGQQPAVGIDVIDRQFARDHVGTEVPHASVGIDLRMG